MWYPEGEEVAGNTCADGAGTSSSCRHRVNYSCRLINPPPDGFSDKNCNIGTGKSPTTVRSTSSSRGTSPGRGVVTPDFPEPSTRKFDTNYNSGGIRTAAASPRRCAIPVQPDYCNTDYRHCGSECYNYRAKTSYGEFVPRRASTGPQQCECYDADVSFCGEDAYRKTSFNSASLGTLGSPCKTSKKKDNAVQCRMSDHGNSSYCISKGCGCDVRSETLVRGCGSPCRNCGYNDSVCRNCGYRPTIMRRGGGVGSTVPGYEGNGGCNTCMETFHRPRSRTSPEGMLDACNPVSSINIKLYRVAEAHRALELLEDYHSRLVKPQDKQLRIAIERVIRIFKSRLFQALLGMC